MKVEHIEAIPVGQQPDGMVRNRGEARRLVLWIPPDQALRVIAGLSAGLASPGRSPAFTPVTLPVAEIIGENGETGAPFEALFCLEPPKPAGS